MPCIHGKGWICTVNNAYKVRVANRWVWFEWNSMYGPTPLRKDGEPLRVVSPAIWKAITRYIARRHKFFYGKTKREWDRWVRENAVTL